MLWNTKIHFHRIEEYKNLQRLSEIQIKLQWITSQTVSATFSNFQIFFQFQWLHTILNCVSSAQSRKQSSYLFEQHKFH